MTEDTSNNQTSVPTPAATATAKEWAEQNAEFIAEYNERVEREGTALQEYRQF